MFYIHLETFFLFFILVLVFYVLPILILSVQFFSKKSRRFFCFISNEKRKIKQIQNIKIESQGYSKNALKIAFFFYREIGHRYPWNLFSYAWLMFPLPRPVSMGQVRMFYWYSFCLNFIWKKALKVPFIKKSLKWLHFFLAGIYKYFAEKILH